MSELDPHEVVRRRLLALLRETERKYIAARLRVSRSAVDKWVAGSSRPSRRHLEVLGETYPEHFPRILADDGGH